MLYLYDKIVLGDSMDKASIINQLYSDLKDNILFDEDVEALSKIINCAVDYDRHQSEEMWLYLMRKYNIKKLKSDIDFSSLIENYPKKYLFTSNISSLLSLICLVPEDNKLIICNTLFNSYNNNYLYEYIKNIILNDDNAKELIEIKTILNFKDISKYVFSSTFFLKNVILMHIKNNKININFLLTLAELGDSIKSKAILKSLLVDYI